MNLRGAGEVEHAELGKPAAAPNPMTHNRIDDSDHEKAENVESAELDSFGNRAGDDGRRGSGKDELKEELCPDRGPGPVKRGINPLVGVPHCWTIIRPSHKPKPLRPKEGSAVPEHESEAHGQESYGGDRKYDEVLGQDGDGIFCPAEAGLDHGETQVHEENQHRRNQGPNRIRGHFCVADLI